MIIGVQPIAAFPSSGHYIRVYDGQIMLGNTAKFLYYLLDVSGNAVSIPKNIQLQSTTYNNWTGDDTFVAATIAQSVGLTPLSGLY